MCEFPGTKTPPCGITFSATGKLNQNFFNTLKCPCLSREDAINKDLKEIRTSWEGVKMEAFNRLGLRRSVRSFVGLRWLGAAVSYYYY